MDTNGAWLNENPYTRRICGHGYKGYCGNVSRSGSGVAVVPLVVVVVVVMATQVGSVDPPILHVYPTGQPVVVALLLLL
jgi:hypothetical protein